MRVAIVGAGVSGLAAARVCSALGFDVRVYESAPDVGGVWSATRRYPGISIQNDKATYSFSERPMPEDYPEYPGGALVRRYLQDYGHAYDLDPLIRLGTRLERADQDPDGTWRLRVSSADGTTEETADWLLVGNGVFSTPHLPTWAGRREFEAAGGAVLSPSEVGDAERLRGRDVVVVGWGKSACDLAAAAVGEAASVTQVARTIRWKLPKRLGRLSFQQILLTRLGEHLLWGPYRTLRGQVLRRLTRPARRVAIRMLGERLERQLRLTEIGLAPDAGPAELDSLVTDGFFEAVRAGRIAVRRGLSVQALGEAEGAPVVTLSDGSIVAASVVVAATGYEQDVTFLGEDVRRRLLDADGALALHRLMVPLEVDRLVFLGWTHSFRSPIGAEIQAMWAAALIAGAVRLPSLERMRRDSLRFWLTHTAAAERLASQLPRNTSILDLDEWIDDFGGRVPRAVRVAELTRPLNPADYAHLLPELVARLGRAGGAGGASVADGPLALQGAPGEGPAGA